MSYASKIKTLEESYRVVNDQIDVLQASANPDQDKLQKLKETRIKYLDQLRELRRLDYEDRQSVDFGDDR